MCRGPLAYGQATAVRTWVMVSTVVRATHAESGQDDRMSDDDLTARYGRGRHPERPLQRVAPPSTAAAADPAGPAVSDLAGAGVPIVEA